MGFCGRCGEFVEDWSLFITFEIRMKVELVRIG